MKLPYGGRDYFVVTYVTDPPLVGTVQASFDHGTTWIDGTPTTVTDDGEVLPAWAWLVAGPGFNATSLASPQEPTDTKAVIPETLTPLLRLAEDPVLSVQEAPDEIRLWGVPA